MNVLLMGERVVMRNQFNAHLRIAGAIDAYWVPSVGWTTFRAVERTKRSPNKLPEDAVLVGRYVAPTKAIQFLDDVEELLKEIGRAPLIARALTQSDAAPCA